MKRIMIIAIALVSMLQTAHAQFAGPSPDFIGTFPQFYTVPDTVAAGVSDTNVAKMAANYYVNGTSKTLQSVTLGAEVAHISGAADTGLIYFLARMNETYGGWIRLDSATVQGSSYHFMKVITGHPYTAYAIVYKKTNVATSSGSVRCLLLSR